MSALRNRLDALRRESGAIAKPPAPPQGLPPAAIAPPEAPDERQRSLAALRERLQRLAPARPMRRSKGTLSDADLAARLGAVELAPGVLVKDSLLCEGEAHGEAQLRTARSAAAIERLGGPEFGPGPGALFFDTETTGLSGGTGTVAFLVGLARFSGEAIAVRQLLLTAYSGEAALYDAAKQWFDKADCVVSFNGKAFDAPLIATRTRLLRAPDPATGLPHLDLLHHVRRAFGTSWNSCRLAMAEARLLGLERRDDLPGEQVPQVWLDWLCQREAGRLDKVMEHNWLDLVSLAVLLPVLADCLDDPLAFGANALALLRQDASRLEDDIYDYLLAYRGRLRPSESFELARLARRRGNWSLAVELWEELAAKRHVEAAVHLAKYYEHRIGDFSVAQGITDRLLELAPGHPELLQRARRLQSKLDKAAARP